MTNEQPSENAQANGETDGEQGSYLPPDAPPNAVMPPNSAQFANATWLRAGPEVLALIEEALNWEEFEDLPEMAYSVVWRRRTAPVLGDGLPLFASIEIMPPRIVWEALQLEVLDFPRFVVDLHWQHFEALREETQYVDRQVLQQHVHHALAALWSENDILSRRQHEFSGFASTVKRFGQWTSGVADIASQLALWPNADE